MDASNDPNRLARLATYLPELKNNPKHFVQFIPQEGRGTADDPLVLGTGVPILSAFGNQFVAMAYEAGWVEKGFNWPEWQKTEEFNALLFDRAFLASANEHQLARLLTAIIRKDRFADGTLTHSFESGLMLAIAERAQALVSMGG